MNLYTVTIRERWNWTDSEVEIEAETAADAITMADFNICKKDLNFKLEQMSNVVNVKAKEK